MMTKRTTLSVAGFCLALVPGLLSSRPSAGQTLAADVYQAGPIRLAPDPSFGKETDWNLLFYDLFCDLAVAPDGSIFAACSRQHKIFKFDPQGKLVKTFGREGQGPGDFKYPDNLSVLDGKYLVVGEYAESRRISLFDLEGNFKQLLTTKGAPFRAVAMRDGKIAYIVFSHRGEGPTALKRIESVVIRGINSALETEVARFTFNPQSIMMRPGGSISFGDFLGGSTFIAATKEGNLVVGNSLQTSLEVFSPAGAKLSSIDLGIEPVPVTNDYRTKYKDHQLDGMRQDSRYSQGPFKDMLKQLEKASFDHLFSDHLPLYREVLTDAEGNLLVFRKTDCLGECPILVRVYSPEGRFICETEVKAESFGLPVDPRQKNMVFGMTGLIALVEVKDAEDFELRLIRVNYGPAPR
jgi:hypothetical protein